MPSPEKSTSNPQHLFAMSLLCLCLFASQQSLADKQFYRYTNEAGEAVITDNLSLQAIHQGYDILNSRMETIQHVAAPPTGKVLEHIKQIQAQKQEGNALRKAYGTSTDATRLMNEQIASLQAQLDINRAAEDQAQSKRADDATRAANLERAGHTPPASLLNQIQTDNQRIQDIQQKNAALRQRIADIRQKFGSIISQLQQQEDQDANNAASRPTSTISE